MPYVGHRDEGTIVNLALVMRQNGDLNPRRFNYPSLPVYLVLSGFVLGGALAVVTGDAESLADLGTKSGRFYAVPMAAGLTKVLFALLSVAALGLAGAVAATVTGRRAALWAAPLIACLSYSYFRLSWMYLNVDIVGAFFALCTLGVLLVRRAGPEDPISEGKPWRAVGAGVFAGLTIGAKYNLFPILIPCLLWHWFYDRRRAASRGALVLAAAGAAFFATTPYALLAHKEFIFGVVAEMRHYGMGLGGRAASSSAGGRCSRGTCSTSRMPTVGGPCASESWAPPCWRDEMHDALLSCSLTRSVSCCSCPCSVCSSNATS
jgi:hypothetical protein